MCADRSSCEELLTRGIRSVLATAAVATITTAAFVILTAIDTRRPDTYMIGMVAAV